MRKGIRTYLNLPEFTNAEIGQELERAGYTDILIGASLCQRFLLDVAAEPQDLRVRDSVVEEVSGDQETHAALVGRGPSALFLTEEELDVE